MAKTAPGLEPAADAGERPRHELGGEQAPPLYRPRQVERPGERVAKAEAAVVALLAHQHHDCVAAPARRPEPVADQ
ncbi:MAG: hypothetical protein V3S87_09525, partial [Alphaproteobacteria bacterium]